MLPLSLLKAAVGQPILVELKSGETYNGTLESCDTYMNMILKGAVCTSRTAEKFTRCTECYIRGNTIKYISIPDEVVDSMPPPEEDKAHAEQYALASTGNHRGGRGGYGYRGGFRGGRGGGGRGGRGARI